LVFEGSSKWFGRPASRPDDDDLHTRTTKEPPAVGGREASNTQTTTREHSERDPFGPRHSASGAPHLEGHRTIAVFPRARLAGNSCQCWVGDRGPLRTRAGSLLQRALLLLQHRPREPGFPNTTANPIHRLIFPFTYTGGSLGCTTRHRTAPPTLLTGSSSRPIHSSLVPCNAATGWRARGTDDQSSLFPQLTLRKIDETGRHVAEPFLSGVAVGNFAILK